MNKKLVAAAIAAAMAAPAAFADVTVYGKAHVSINSVDGDGAAYDGESISSRASRIGFKGSEDLGNGLKAVWKFESEIKIDNSSGLSGGRDAYLGMAGNFGTFLAAGRINTPYKKSTGKLDFFGDTLVDYNNTVRIEDNRVNNALVYISPKFSGAQFAGAIVAGESAANNSLAEAYSVALTYKNAGIIGAIAYEDLDTLVSAGKGKTKWRAGLGYKWDAFKVAGVYESRSDIGGVAGADSDAWQISGAYTMGNNTLKAMYGSYDLDNSSNDGESWAIGVDHKMSKRTKVYGLYGDTDNSLRGDGDTKVSGVKGSGFSVGMIHSF